MISTTVTADQVAGELGYMMNHLMQRAREFKIPFEERQVSRHHATQTVFTVGAAVELMRRCRALDEEHSRRWLAYQAYLAEEKEKADRKRQEAIAKAREESRRRNLKAAAEYRERREREAMQLAAEEAAKRARREGEPMSWERFLKRSA